MNIIYYQTKTQFENTGDALINKALISVIRNYGILKCNCSKNIPSSFIKELEIKENEKVICNNEFSLAFNILKNAIIAKKNKDKVYLVSGLGHQWGNGFKYNFKIFLSIFIFILYRILDVRIIKIGLSIGPIGKKTSFLEKIKSKFINYYYVRDSKSLEFCKNIGIKKVKLCPDISWIYLYKSKRKLNNSNIVTVSLRESILNESDEKYKNDLLKRTLNILQILNKNINNMCVKIIYQVKRDRNFNLRTYDYLKKYFNCEFVDKQILLNDAEKVYGESRYNLSSRLHSLLLGYKYGSIPIAIIDKEKHIKISQIFVDSQIDELICDLNSKNYEENIQNIVNNSNFVYEKIIRIEKEKSNEIILILNKIFNI